MTTKARDLHGRPSIADQVDQIMKVKNEIWHKWNKHPSREPHHKHRMAYGFVQEAGSLPSQHIRAWLASSRFRFETDPIVYELAITHNEVPVWNIKFPSGEVVWMTADKKPLACHEPLEKQFGDLKKLYGQTANTNSRPKVRLGSSLPQVSERNSVWDSAIASFQNNRKKSSASKIRKQSSAKKIRKLSSATRSHFGRHSISGATAPTEIEAPSLGGITVETEIRQAIETPMVELPVERTAVDPGDQTMTEESDSRLYPDPANAPVTNAYGEDVDESVIHIPAIVQPLQYTSVAESAANTEPASIVSAVTADSGVTQATNTQAVARQDTARHCQATYCKPRDRCDRLNWRLQRNYPIETTRECSPDSVTFVRTSSDPTRSFWKRLFNPTLSKATTPVAIALTPIPTATTPFETADDMFNRDLEKAVEMSAAEAEEDIDNTVQGTTSPDAKSPDVVTSDTTPLGVITFNTAPPDAMALDDAPPDTAPPKAMTSDTTPPDVMISDNTPPNAMASDTTPAGVPLSDATPSTTMSFIVPTPAPPAQASVSSQGESRQRQTWAKGRYGRVHPSQY